jgi:esterase/lipase
MVGNTRDGKSELKGTKKDSLQAARVQKEMDDKQTHAILALKKQQSLDSAKVESLRKELNEKETKNQDDRVDTLQTQLYKLQKQVARLHKDLDLVHMEKLDVIVLLDKLIRAAESKNGLDHIKMKEALVLVNDGEPSLVGTESTLTDSSNDEGWFCRPCT